MTRIYRRQLLRGTLATLATLGWGQYNPLHVPYASAQPTPRKLALLIGINDYQDENITPLQGCITDVRLQEQLLRDRYGFQPADILTLLDGEATRDGILNAIETHLIQQASPGDIVVLHFSGHTVFVREPNCGMDDCLMGVLMPVDGAFPETEDWLSTVASPPEGSISRPELADILGRLATDQLTVVLDVMGGGSFATETGFAKGVLLAASAAEQLADESVFDGVHAGVFTYVLTRYLWQQSGDQSFEVAIEAIASEVQALSDESQIVQTPMLFSEPNRDHGQQPTYFTVPQTPPASPPSLSQEPR
ncbi:MAG: caspase family protein [Cyanobacteria bacterium J06642_9]